MSKCGFPWFHSTSERLYMMRMFINKDSSSFDRVQHGQNHLAIGSLTPDVFVKISNEHEDIFDHFIQNWLYLAFKHMNNKDIAQNNLRPAKTYHIVRTLTEKELSTLEKLVNRLEAQNSNKATKLRKVFSWQRSLKDKVISLAVEIQEKHTRDSAAKINKDLSLAEILNLAEEHNNSMEWEPDILKDKRQTILFMENVSHLQNMQKTNGKGPIDLYRFSIDLLQRFGVKPQDLETYNIMCSSDLGQPNVFIDPDYSIPFILRDTRPSHRPVIVPFERVDLKDKTLRQHVYNPGSRKTLPEMDVPDRYRPKNHAYDINPLFSLHEMWTRLTGLRTQAKQVHNELKSATPKSDSDASLN